MEIVYRKLVDLKPHPDNPRKVKDENSIAEFAEKIRTNPKHFEARPILLSNRTGELVIIGGERRWESAAYLGLETAPSILIEGLTEDEETRILFEDNTHSGVWDDSKLQKWNKMKLKKWGVPTEAFTQKHTQRKTEFQKKFEEYNNSNCDFPIVPVADEKHEMFIIISSNETDSNWLREKLGMQRMKSYKSDEIAKANIISIEELKNVL